ncbi:MAG TPA: hypothetical protein VMW24_24855 [Sedimentisphaerales bacterium]|nr:hypothetical protein [Sedimentisphaerales bacterium]
MAEFSLWGLGGMVLVTGIMEVIKYCFPKLKDRWTVGVSVAAGVGLSWLAQTAKLYPEAATVINVTGAGLLAGFAACGFFSGLKKRS